MKFAVIALVLFGALAALLILGVLAGSIPTYELSEFLASDYSGGKVALVGRLASIESEVPLRFTIHGRDNDLVALRVASEKAPPENFQLGREVGLRGNYDPDTETFHAYRIETACPSRYEATKDGEEPGQPQATGGKKLSRRVPMGAE